MKDYVVFYVYDDLDIIEGVGDDVTDIPTGSKGVTKAARMAVDLPNASDSVVALKYLDQNYTKLANRLDGYLDAPLGVQAAILDLSYNLGMSIANYNGLACGLANNDWYEAMLQTLDTANVEGKTMKGIAKRRAIMFNKARVGDSITEVEQLEDGTIIYRNRIGETIFKYRKPRHSKSSAGIIKIEEV